MIPQTEIKGLYVPIYTPMRRNGVKCSVDFPQKFYDLIDLMATYAKGIVVCGTTGQGALLNASEQVEIAERVGKYLHNKAHFIAGISSNSLDGAIDLAQEIERRLGPTTFLHAIGINGISQKQAEDYIRNLVGEIRGNLLLYGSKQRNSNFEIDTILNLANNPKVIGIKDCSMDKDKIRKMIKKSKRRDFAILAGNDRDIAHLIQEGARGAIAATAHFAPRIVAEIVNSALKNDFSTAYTYQRELDKLVEGLFYGAYVPSVIAFAFGTNVRGPYESLFCSFPEKINEIKKVLSKFSPEERGIDISKYRMC